MSGKKGFRMRPTNETAPHNRSPKGRPSTSRARTGGRYWSARVTRESDALDLKKGVFKLDDPKKIAASLKHSAERSHRRKADPYRSALSMLAFYINRGGKNLSARRKQFLQRANAELKRLFHKE
jgi:hypothetical protein